MKPRPTSKRALATILASLAASGAGAVSAQDIASDARALHERLLVLDTHLDTPVRLVDPDWNIRERHSATEDFSQVDLPRLTEGGLDGGWWVIFSPQGPLTPTATAASLETARERLRLIRALTTDHPDAFALALSAADASRIATARKRVVFISIENAYPLTDRPDALETFHDQGVRMLGLVHFANNALADSATDPAGPRWRGLSPEGRRLVSEANRLGIVIDASHASDEAFDQLITYSATPIILSHSGPRDVFDHPRNVSDERLRRLAASGGVIQINALGAYLTALEESPERETAMAALRERFGPSGQRSQEQTAAYLEALGDLNRRHPPAQADFEDFISHLLHALAVVGPRHVGIGADWDGGGGVVGLNDVSALPRITERLLAEGYSARDLADIWSGNALRLLERAEAHAVRLNASPAASPDADAPTP